jgi:hypothetical protein
MFELSLIVFTFRWMEACLKDELPPTTELEEALRTGVILARLGNFFAPDVVPVRKIYDRELKRFQVGLEIYLKHFQLKILSRKAMRFYVVINNLDFHWNLC